MATVKPKKRPVPFKSGPISSAPAPRKAVRPAVRKAASTTPQMYKGPGAGGGYGTAAPAAPAAPKLTPVPAAKVAVGPPMPSLQTTSDRNAARYDFGVTIGDINRQARELAMSYGGAPQALQYGYAQAPDGGAWGDTTSQATIGQNAPGSQLEVMLRNLGLTKQNIDDVNTGQNTFMSGRRLTQLGAADTDYNAQVAEAKRQYDAAIGQLTTAYQQSMGTRNQNLTNADNADAAAAAAAAIEPQAAAPPPDQPLPGEIGGGPATYGNVTGEYTGELQPWGTNIGSPETQSHIGAFQDAFKKKKK